MLEGCKLLGWLVRTNNRQAGYLFIPVGYYAVACLCTLLGLTICSIFLLFDFSSTWGCLYVYSFNTFYLPFALRFFCLPYCMFWFDMIWNHAFICWNFDGAFLWFHGFLSMWCNKKLPKDKLLHNSIANNWDSITHVNHTNPINKYYSLILM